MSDIDNNKQQIIDEYESKVNYYNNLKDDVTNLTKAVSDMKASIKNTQQMQEKIKQDNYSIWSSLDAKPTNSKPTEKPQPTVADILGELLK